MPILPAARCPSANHFYSSLRVVVLLDFVLKCGYLDQTSLRSHNDVWLLYVHPVKKCKEHPVITFEENVALP